jgi:molecular chaperone DnaK (HSP70)
LCFKKDNKEYILFLEEKDFNSKILDVYLKKYLNPIINDLIELILIENELEMDKINSILNVGEMFEISYVKQTFEKDYIKGTMSNFFEISLSDKTYKEHIENALNYLENENVNNVSIEISDVCAQNISFKLIGNKCSTIIDKNNNYDKTVSKEMYLLDLNKDYFNLILYEGNYLRIDRNYFINNFNIYGFNIENKNDNDEIVIKVNFNLNRNGVLNIEAFEMGNNIKNENDNKKLPIKKEINDDLENDKKLLIRQ